MSKRILVTGGAGFIGSHTVDELINRGHRVRVFDNLEPQVHGDAQELPSYLNPEAEFVLGDVRDQDSIRRAIDKIEVVLHLAAVVGVGQSMYKIHRYVDINSLGTANLLDILANEKHSVERLIVASSMSIYGEGAYTCASCGIVCPNLRQVDQLRNREWEMKCPRCGSIVEPAPTREEKPLSPASIYAISKRDQEEMCLAVGKAYKIPTVALRYFNTYGPRQALSNPYTGVAAIFSSRILNLEAPIIFEDGLQSRDFVHVSDVAQANVSAIEKDKVNYEVLNVGTGRAQTVLDMAHTLAKTLGVQVMPRIEQRFREGDIRHCYAGISKTQNVLDFSPKVTFENGIAELARWVNEQESVDKVEQAMIELEQRSLTR